MAASELFLVSRQAAQKPAKSIIVEAAELPPP
jgi:hypothetical protein